MLDGVISVHAVDVQQIHRAVVDAFERLVEGAAQQRRKRGEALIMIGTELLVHRFVIARGVRIAFPSVDGKALRIQLASHHRVAKRCVRNAVMGSQLDHDPRPRRTHDPLREGHMAPPCADAAAPLGEPKQGFEVGVAELTQRR